MLATGGGVLLAGPVFLRSGMSWCPFYFRGFGSGILEGSRAPRREIPPCPAHPRGAGLRRRAAWDYVAAEPKRNIRRRTCLVAVGKHVDLGQELTGRSGGRRLDRVG